MREHVVSLPDGLQVFVREHGKGTPIVFVHGNWSSSAWLVPAMEHMPAGYRSIAYDIRGRGRTQGPHTDYSIASLAADLRHLAAAMQLGRFHLVGHSLGSAIAMEYARTQAQTLTSLTVAAPSWIDGMPDKLYNHAGQRALKQDRALFAKVLRPLAPSGPFGEVWDALVDAGHSQQLEATLANLDALRTWRPGDALRNLHPNTRLIYGSLDVLVDTSTEARVAEVLGAKRTQLAGVGHCIPIEAPALFVQALELPHG